MLNTFNPNDAQGRHREVTFVAKMVDSSVTQPKHGVLQRMTGDIRHSLRPPGRGREKNCTLLKGDFHSQKELLTWDTNMAAVLHTASYFPVPLPKLCLR